MSLTRPTETEAYVGHGVAAAAAAACLLLAILGWNEVTEALTGMLFNPDDLEVSKQADAWVRVGLAVVALVLLAIRGIWVDVALVVLAGLALSALLGSGHATYRTFAKTPPAPAPTKMRASTDARVAVPSTKVQSPPIAVPRDKPAVLVTVVAVRDAEGKTTSTEARRHLVTPRQQVAAEEPPAEDVVVDVVRGTNDETSRALIADLNAASAIYLLPD